MHHLAIDELPDGSRLAHIPDLTMGGQGLTSQEQVIPLTIDKEQPQFT